MLKSDSAELCVLTEPTRLSRAVISPLHAILNMKTQTDHA